MSQLHQMQMSYVAEEDRILWRINTTDGAEVRFWVTRRYLALLWRVVSDIKAQADQAKHQGRIAPPIHPTPPIPPIIPSPLSGSTPVPLTADADFAPAFEEASKLPLGEHPALLVHVGVRTGPQQQALLCVQPQGQQGVEVALNEKILNGLCVLIVHTVAQIGWRLDLIPDGPGSPPNPGNPGLN
jgi:hypothetical protein